MANDGKIVFEVTADGKHAIADIKEITRAIQQETGKWDSAAKTSTDNIGNTFTSLLKKVTAGFSAVKIGKALLDFGKDAIQAASDLQEVQNVVDVTFGANSNKIETWAKNAGTQFGLTETQAKKFSSTMGAMLKSSGLTGDKIVDVSTDLAGLAADMASFYNLDFEEAFSKIRSGMSGMSMPLKELGIDMSVDTLNAFALAQGLEKTFNQMDQSEQTMLRYQYLMQATADAQGDFARTSDSFANAKRQLETNLTQLTTNIGSTLLPFVNGLVQSVNSLFEDKSGEKTVLDDFANIDAQTEAKLEGIRTAATDARLLVDELDKLGGGKAAEAGGQLQQLATDLSNISFEDGKANAVKDFVAVLGQNIDIIAGIQDTDADGAKAWLEGIAQAAGTLDENDAKGWTDLLNSIKEGLPGIEETDFGSGFFAALSSGFSDIESKSSVLQWAVETLGNKTNRTAEEQGLWLETCERLVKTIPGLSSIINTETGEIKGGTDAVKAYIKAWEEGQTKLAMLGALQEKEDALSARFSDLPGLQLDMAVAEKRVRDNFKQLKALYKKYGVDLGFDESGKIVRDFNAYGLQGDQIADLNEQTDYYETLVGNANDAREAYEKQAKALDEAKAALAEYRQTIEGMGGDVEAVTDATEEFYQNNAEQIKTLVEAANTALSELGQYAQGVHDNIESSVSSTVKGFEKITTAADKKVADLTGQLDKLGDKTADNEEEWQQLTDAINAVSGSQSATTVTSMTENLRQQAQYMDSYLENLNKARANGVSAEILAQLSDGSTESYDYLAALAEATPEEAQRINAEYQKVIDKKKELTDELTEQQLSADQTYKTLAEAAKQAVAELDLEGEAATNAGKTVKGVAQGIADHISDVQIAVDSIIAEVDRLAGLGISVSMNGIDFGISTTVVNSPDSNSHRPVRSYASGSQFIPQDMVARLHEGERVLTAQENQVYTALLNGGLSGVDLDQLGGVMRDNVKAGGNVYLDGRIVGAVVSDRQGKSYKSLQRSGWQS